MKAKTVMINNIMMLKVSLYNYRCYPSKTGKEHKKILVLVYYECGYIFVAIVTLCFHNKHLLKRHEKAEAVSRVWKNWGFGAVLCGKCSALFASLLILERTWTWGVRALLSWSVTCIIAKLAVVLPGKQGVAAEAPRLFLCDLSRLMWGQQRPAESAQDPGASPALPRFKEEKGESAHPGICPSERPAAPGPRLAVQSSEL